MEDHVQITKVTGKCLFLKLPKNESGKVTSGTGKRPNVLYLDIFLGSLFFRTTFVFNKKIPTLSWLSAQI